MIDHLTLSSAKYETSKAFYKAALAPLGYSLLKSSGAKSPVLASVTDLIFGWQAIAKRLSRFSIWRSLQKLASRSMNFIGLPSQPAGLTMGLPDFAKSTGRIITRLLYSIPTDRISKPFAESNPADGACEERTSRGF
jgi:hypothetical protein